MNNQKKSKPHYSLKGLAKNIFDEFYNCSIVSGGLSKRYYGIFLYGVESNEVLDIVKNEIIQLMKTEDMIKLMDEYGVNYEVMAEAELPAGTPEFVRKRGSSGYQAIDLGWFINEGWIDDPILEKLENKVKLAC